MAMFRLAHALGRPLREIEALPVDVFIEWLAFFQLRDKEDRR